MTDALATARRQFLDPAGLDEGHLDRVLGETLSTGAEDADLYFQYSRTEHWSLEEGIVKSGSHSVEQGVGVRAIDRKSVV